MKRYGNLFEQAFTLENLHAAYLDARRHKRATRACFQFERGLGANLNDLHNELHSGSYQPRPYHTFTVFEPKPRIIHAPAFRDCVVQHAIYRIINPIFDRSFIDQSYACRKGQGTHKCADYAQNALRQSKPGSYTLKLDIRKFFYSIDRDILSRIIERKIKDPRMLAVMLKFTEHSEPAGIPIGNLLSQIYALIYLNPLDHYIKRQLKVKKYARYVDDFVLFDLTIDQARQYKEKIETFIHESLKLKLSKWTIAKTSKGINFVGYRTWRNHRFIRKYSLYKAKKAIKKGKMESLASLIGHARYTGSLRHILYTTQELNYALHCSLPARIRRLHHTPPAHPRASQRRRRRATGNNPGTTR
jgi:retron-type reverse transcriptase